MNVLVLHVICFEDNHEGLQCLKHEDFNDMYCATDTVWVIMSMRMRLVGHVAYMAEKKHVYRVLVGKPEGERPLGRRRHRWQIMLVA